MNVNDQTMDKLKKAWDKADTLDVQAFIRISDPCGGLDFYPIAVDPVDEDTLLCIIDSVLSLEIAKVSAQDIFALHDSTGTHAYIDRNFDPVSAQKLYKKLKEKHGTTKDY